MQKYKTLNEFLDSLKEPRKSEVEALRKIILNANSGLKEQLKWNAPSYFYHHDDRITFNMFDKDRVRLVFHAGGKAREDKKLSPAFKDETGLLEWQSNIRAMITFGDVQDIEHKRKRLVLIVKKWLEIFD